MIEYEDFSLKIEPRQGDSYPVKAAMEAGDWTAAVSALESLLAEAPDYEDAGAHLEAARLERARQRQQMAAKKPATLPPNPAKPKKPPTLPKDAPRPQGHKPTSLPDS